MGRNCAPTFFVVLAVGEVKPAAGAASSDCAATGAALVLRGMRGWWEAGQWMGKEKVDSKVFVESIIQIRLTL